MHTNIDRYKLQWILTFIAVAEHGSFTAAARAVNRAQPRVSGHIAALEDALGARLLKRGTQKVELTSAGTRFLFRAQRMCHEFGAGIEEVAALSNELEGHIKIGSYPGASAVLIAPLMQRFQLRFPRVKLELIEGEANYLEKAVNAGDVDIAIRPADAPRHHHELASQILCRERIVLIAPSGHCILRSNRPLLGSLVNESIIVTGDPHRHWSDYRDRLDREGVDPENTVVALMPTTVVAMVTAGLGIGLLGAFAAHMLEKANIHAVKLPLPLWQREIQVLFRGDKSADSELATYFLGMLTQEGPGLSNDLASW
ncbi:LysR family transcriptional regulator [Salinicola corii]|uniref:LysR family transcriptional regulator n=1 Tax=Salinicola corii TaxID=2606937 RepID=A0A640W9P0_9GAMM|nr:LysR family transcriptional regulator [Salinicola corii]KAA0016031.1 LysR family transcriptional regulator [Salinicola corii]